MAPTATTGRELTSRALANRRAYDVSSKGRCSWVGYDRANNGGQQPKLLMSNIRHTSRAASELPFA